jgi:hypothetical protein
MRHLRLSWNNLQGVAVTDKELSARYLKTQFIRVYIVYPDLKKWVFFVLFKLTFML